MITLLLVALPLLAAAICFFCKNSQKGPGFLLASVAILELVLAGICFELPEGSPWLTVCPKWLGFDILNGVVLLVTALLFLCVSLHTLRWMPAEIQYGEEGETTKFSNFCACLLAFLGTMMLVILAQNLGLLWVAVEATTLVSAPLIIFHRGSRSVEAMWKYLLICSVGIGFALFGTMLLAVASRETGAGLDLAGLMEQVALIHPGWYKAAFVFVLVGYGTKMGLAPFHTWLPDAHSEAPGVVSALLSGALLNCSFLGIIRVATLAPEGAVPFVSHALIALGLVSLAVAAFFIAGQRDFKRMLAYSSVEHMGLLALFLGTGCLHWGFCHLVGHSLLKMTLFLLAGNFLLACGTRQIPRLGGLLKSMPRTSFLWMIAVLMVCGMPPSPLFFTELQLFLNVDLWLGITVAVLLFAVFAGMTYAVHRMVMGEPGTAAPTQEKAAVAEKLWVVPLVVVVASIFFGSVMIFCFMEGGR